MGQHMVNFRFQSCNLILLLGNHGKDVIQQIEDLAITRLPQLISTPFIFAE